MLLEFWSNGLNYHAKELQKQNAARSYKKISTRKPPCHQRRTMSCLRLHWWSHIAGEPLRIAPLIGAGEDAVECIGANGGSPATAGAFDLCRCGEDGNSDPSGLTAIVVLSQVLIFLNHHLGAGCRRSWRKRRVFLIRWDHRQVSRKKTKRLANYYSKNPFESWWNEANIEIKPQGLVCHILVVDFWTNSVVLLQSERIGRPASGERWSFWQGRYSGSWRPRIQVEPPAVPLDSEGPLVWKRFPVKPTKVG